MRRYKEDIRTALARLQAGRYRTIYADPPWAWMRGGSSAPGAISKITGRGCAGTMGATPYNLMKTDELVALGPLVKRVAAADSHLYLWTINKTVPDAAAIIEAWGYRWTSMITWAKDGGPGLAKYFQGVTEHCVFAVRGRLPYRFIDGRMAQGRTLISAPRGVHSEKPAAMREMIERVSYSPYLELFARRNPSRKWDAVGLELEEL